MTKFNWVLPEQNKQWFLLDEAFNGDVIARQEDVEEYLIGGVGDIPNTRLLLKKENKFFNFESGEQISLACTSQMYGKLFSVVL